MANLKDAVSQKDVRILALEDTLQELQGEITSKVCLPYCHLFSLGTFLRASGLKACTDLTILIQISKKLVCWLACPGGCQRGQSHLVAEAGQDP